MYRQTSLQGVPRRPAHSTVFWYTLNATAQVAARAQATCRKRRKVQCYKRENSVRKAPSRVVRHMNGLTRRICSLFAATAGAHMLKPFWRSTTQFSSSTCLAQCGAGIGICTKMEHLAQESHPCTYETANGLPCASTHGLCTEKRRKTICVSRKLERKEEVK